MWNLISGGREGGEVLRDVCVNRRVIGGDAVDVSEVPVKSSLGDLSDGRRDGGAEEESLADGSWRELGGNVLDVVSEAHVKESIGFIKDKLANL